MSHATITHESFHTHTWVMSRSSARLSSHTRISATLVCAASPNYFRVLSNTSLFLISGVYAYIKGSLPDVQDSFRIYRALLWICRALLWWSFVCTVDLRCICGCVGLFCGYIGLFCGYVGLSCDCLLWVCRLAELLKGPLKHVTILDLRCVRIHQRLFCGCIGLFCAWAIMVCVASPNYLRVTT